MAHQPRNADVRRRLADADVYFRPEPVIAADVNVFLSLTFPGDGVEFEHGSLRRRLHESRGRQVRCSEWIERK